MDAQTITLFIACLVFAVVNFLANTWVRRELWLKLLTLVLGLAGLAGACYLLATSFIRYLSG